MVPRNRRKKDEITCVQLSKKTRDQLAELGTKKDTFEKIILGIMERPASCEIEGESVSE